MARNETRARSIAKALSYRAIGTIGTAGVAYLIAGKWSVAAAIGGAEVAVKIGIYFFHERIWDRVSFGRMELCPTVIWITGLPCSGKTTLANRVTETLIRRGQSVEKLDGDEIRSLFPNAGFSRVEREAHVQRIGFLASRLQAHGVHVVVSLVSPYQESRDFARRLCRNYIEVYLSTPLAECERRDVKGMYAQARRGELDGFTGVGGPYEPPLCPELTIDTSAATIEECLSRTMKIVARMSRKPISSRWFRR